MQYIHLKHSAWTKLHAIDQDKHWKETSNVTGIFCNPSNVMALPGFFRVRNWGYVPGKADATALASTVAEHSGRYDSAVLVEHVMQILLGDVGRKIGQVQISRILFLLLSQWSEAKQNVQKKKKKMSVQLYSSVWHLKAKKKERKNCNFSIFLIFFCLCLNRRRKNGEKK